MSIIQNNAATTSALPFMFGDFAIPANCRRIFITAELEPSTDGALVQPTGFPDLGPVLYPDPSGKNGLLCLIESEASMANRLEEVCFQNKYEGTFLDTFRGIPYLRVEENNTFTTASTLDGHRFASDFLAGRKALFEKDKGTMELAEYIKNRLEMSGDGTTMPIANIPNMFPLVMELDTMSLIHGFQISNKKLKFVGLRMPRALTASIVAFGCERVTVPGVKFNVGQVESDSGQAIFQKQRITAKKIEVRFSIDIGLLTSLRLVFSDTQNDQKDEVEKTRRQLLIAIALWKVAAFLDLLKIEYSLRTECKLHLKGNPTYKAEDGTSPAQKDFDYASIKNGSDDSPMKNLIDGAKLPEDRSPLTLT